MADPGAELPTRIVTGPGTVDRLGELVREQAAERVFLITDQGLVAAGHVARAEQALAAAGVGFRRFDQVSENPSSDDVETCRRALGDYEAELLIGFGGGSSIDVAKGCAFVHAGGGRMEDYWGVGRAKGRLLPLIAVPTTAGTGTEVQSFALIEQPGTHQKMACGDPQAAPVIALLDATLTLTMPRRVTACTGLDAVGHAVETAVTTRRNEASARHSTEAFRLACHSLNRVLDRPDDLVAHTDMLQAATSAGMAIEYSMLGAAHSMANPLTAHHGIAHGQAVGMALPHVVRFNAEDPTCAGIYADLARAAGICPAGTSTRAAVDALVGKLEQLLEATGLPVTWSGLRISDPDVRALATEAAAQWTARFNPRPVDAADFARLFSGL